MARAISKLQETGRQMARQSDQFVLRTRDAGRAFLEETRDASRDVAVFVRSEAKRWRHFAWVYAGRLGSDVRAAMSLPEVERRLLVRVGGMLRTLDAQVRGRLAALDHRGSNASSSRRKTAPRRRKPKDSAQRLAA